MLRKSRLAVYKGTPEYMAPEIIYNGKYSSHSDWFALGVIIVELITPQAKLKPLFSGKSTIDPFEIMKSLNCDEVIEEYMITYHRPFIEHLRSQKPNDRGVDDILRTLPNKYDFANSSDILSLLQTPRLQWKEQMLILAHAQLQEHPAARLHPEIIVSLQQEAPEQRSKRQSIDTTCNQRCTPKCCLIQ